MNRGKSLTIARLKARNMRSSQQASKDQGTRHSERHEETSIGEITIYTLYTVCMRSYASCWLKAGDAAVLSFWASKLARVLGNLSRSGLFQRRLRIDLWLGGVPTSGAFGFRLEHPFEPSRLPFQAALAWVFHGFQAAKRSKGWISGRGGTIFCRGCYPASSTQPSTSSFSGLAKDGPCRCGAESVADPARRC